MWRWIERWNDWLARRAIRVMRDLFWPLHRTGVPQARGLHFGYEKAGLVIRDEAVPWNADAIFVDAFVQFPANLGRLKNDFHLSGDGIASTPPHTLHPAEVCDLFRLQFRLPPIRRTTSIELRWRNSLLSQATLPMLSTSDFIESLHVHAPTTFVRLGETTVPARACIGNQCRGLLASGLLTGSTSLAPLVDLDLTVEFHDSATNESIPLPVRLTSNQLQSHEALINVVCPQRPARIGVWTVRWLLAETVLARTELRVLPQRALKPSLMLLDARFVHHDPKRNRSTMTRHLPKLSPGDRIAPCFLVASREPGMATAVPFEVRIQSREPRTVVAALSQETIVTDGPSLVMPGTVSADDLSAIEGFELRWAGKVLGHLSTKPAPSAQFTSEGGFVPPDDYHWGSSFEEELTERLAKLT